MNTEIRLLSIEIVAYVFFRARKNKEQGEIKLDRLRDNLHAILTISDQFLPKAGLKKATKKLYL